MTRVNISGSNHQVEVQHDGADLAYVIEKAQKLWNETAPAEPSAPAYGFTAQSSAGQRGPAYFRYGRRPDVTG